MRTIQEFRHIRMMKRGGRGNIKDGIATTSEGDLAILCPACPHVDINLPPNWRDVEFALKYA